MRRARSELARSELWRYFRNRKEPGRPTAENSPLLPNIDTERGKLRWYVKTIRSISSQFGGLTALDDPLGNRLY